MDSNETKSPITLLHSSGLGTESSDSISPEDLASGFNELIQFAMNFSSFWAPTSVLTNHEGFLDSKVKSNATKATIQFIECFNNSLDCSYSEILDPHSSISSDFDYYNQTILTNLNFNSTNLVPNLTIVDNTTTVVVEPDLKIHHPALAVFLAIICIGVIFGNLLVMVAIWRERYLHTVTNYFIASLAAADCLVGAVVMPFSVVDEVMNKWWIFGQDICDLWHSFDVLASTGSILNLCIISLDRYWAITDPISYPARMTPTKASILIVVVWTCSSLISFPAIIWWRSVSSEPQDTNQCKFTEDVGYLIFSSIISFYGPLFVMLFVYFRIYRAAIEQTRSVKLGTKEIKSSNGSENMVTLRIHRGGLVSNNTVKSNALKPKYSGDASSDEHDFTHGPENGTSIRNRNMKAWSISRKLTKLAKERKAAKTLGIVMGVFILCWLPFFITNILMGICPESCIGDVELHYSIVTWLGWLNSGMNPAIYACWSKDFRRAFHKILCSCCYKRQNRGRTLKQSNYSYSAKTGMKRTIVRRSSPKVPEKSFGMASLNKAPTSSTCSSIAGNDFFQI